MEPTALRPAATRAADPAPAVQEPAPHRPQTPPVLDLSHLQPPRKLADARLEEVTIDGICGVY